VVTPIQYLKNTTLILKTDVSTTDVLLTSISKPYKQHGIPLSLSMLHPSHMSVSFDWNSLVEPHIISYIPFQIRVKDYSKTIYQCIIYEGISKIFLFSLNWKDIGFPKLMLARSQLLDFDIGPSEYSGILP
jgi:hypothetical protein